MGQIQCCSFHPLHQIKIMPQNKLHQNSPISIINNTLKTNNLKISISNNPPKNIGPISALPKYNVHKIPSNYTVNLNPTKPTLHQKSIQFYVDGSCIPNSGKGAYGWFTPNFTNFSNHYRTYKYDYPVTITRCEIMAIISTLHLIKNNPIKTQQEINIYSDSKTCLLFIKLVTYPKYHNIKILIESILKLLNLIQYQQPLTTINFHKVKSHSNVKGNEIIDKYVNMAARQIKE